MSQCFIIMPISTPEHLLGTYHGDVDHFRHVLDHLFVPAIEKAGLKAVPPKAEGAEVIHAKIVKNIEESDLVLCDMSALNPNVFFELGIRTAVDKPACMVVDDVTVNIPFDTSIVNYQRYNSGLEPWVLPEEVEKLSVHIRAAQVSSGERNSLWRYFGLSARAAFSEKDTGLEAKVDLIGIRLDGLQRQLADTSQASRSQRREEERERSRAVLFRMLSIMATEAGVTLRNGGYQPETGQMLINVGGEVPEALEAKMRGIAEAKGVELKILSGE
jgi:hypothetical protein